MAAKGGEGGIVDGGAVSEPGKDERVGVVGEAEKVGLGGFFESGGEIDELGAVAEKVGEGVAGDVARFAEEKGCDLCGSGGGNKMSEIVDAGEAQKTEEGTFLDESVDACVCD